MGEKLRLQKYISRAGFASRRAAEEMIRAGRVKVNGHPAGIGDSVDADRDVVTVDGERLRVENSYIYVAVNKPRGYVTTLADERGRHTVAEIVAEEGVRLYPVGRLDRDSEGLLLMTNDGEFANMIMHPSRHVAKTYTVAVTPAATEAQLNQLAAGVELDGKKTLPAGVMLTNQTEDRSHLRITIHEGRKRQIRRMCEAVGLEVLRLKRVSIGPLALKGLPVGKYRVLTKQEVAALRRAAQSPERAN